MGASDISKFEIFYELTLRHTSSTPDRQRNVTGLLRGKIGGDLLHLYVTAEANIDAQQHAELVFTPGVVNIVNTLPNFTATQSGRTLNLTITSITLDGNNIKINYTITTANMETEGWSTVLAVKYLVA